MQFPDRCDEAALVHWVPDVDEPPSWAEAHRRLQGEGWRLRVSHPSEGFPVRVGPRDQSLERLTRSRRHEIGDPLLSKTRPEVEARSAQIALEERQIEASMLVTGSRSVVVVNGK
jgi:hypothetical protein